MAKFLNHLSFRMISDFSGFGSPLGSFDACFVSTMTLGGIIWKDSKIRVLKKIFRVIGLLKRLRAIRLLIGLPENLNRLILGVLRILN